MSVEVFSAVSVALLSTTSVGGPESTKRSDGSSMPTPLAERQAEPKEVHLSPPALRSGGRVHTPNAARELVERSPAAATNRSTPREPVTVRSASAREVVAGGAVGEVQQIRGLRRDLQDHRAALARARLEVADAQRVGRQEGPVVLAGVRPIDVIVVPVRPGFIGVGVGVRDLIR